MIKKILQKIFKKISYFFFFKIYGKIENSITSDSDKRIQVEIAKINENLEYKVYKIGNGRLYTDRIHDAAAILDNKIIEGPSFQLRAGPESTIQFSKASDSIVFSKGTPRRLRKLNGSVLSLLTGGGGNNNYWHWLFDVLPRFGLCGSFVNLKEIDYFLLPSLLKKFQKETLDLLNIPKEKRISSNFFRHIHCPEIFVTDHPYVITKDATHDIQNIPSWIPKWLKKKYINDGFSNNSNLPKKIYIDRKDAKSHDVRSIINEDEVKNFLIKRGFKSLIMKDFHFSDQVKIFNNAEIVIGLHGAAFANLCFCKPGTRVVELGTTTTGKMIENIAVINGLIHKSISCEHKESEYNQSVHINVSIDLLKKTIEDLD